MIEFLVILLLTPHVALGGTGGVKSTFTDLVFQDRVSELSVRLLKLTMKQDETKNILFSPVTVYQSLMTLYMGAATGSREELMALLGLTKQQHSTAVKGYKYLRQIDKNGYSSAHKLFYDESLAPLDANFTENVGDYLTPINVKRNPSGAMGAINRWVEQRTVGKVSEVLKSPLNNRALLSLVGVSYHEMDWLHPFYSDVTKTAAFVTPRGEERPVPVMHQEKYLRNGHVSRLRSDVIAFPCNDAYTFAIFLPSPGRQTLEGLVDALEPDKLKSYVSGLPFSTVEVKIPRMRVTDVMDLDQVLQAAGSSLRVFSAVEADFSKMTRSKAHLAVMRHVAILNLDKAVTPLDDGQQPGVVSYGNRGEGFSAFRPFVYMVFEKKQKYPEFMGVMRDPTLM